MANESAAAMNDLVRAHSALKADDVIGLRSRSMDERSALIESACEAAAVIARSRIAAGLPPVEPAPWPASTWELLRKHASRVRT